MLVSDIARKVRRVFGDTNSTFITDADIIDWVNDGTLQIARETKSPAFKMTTTLTSGQTVVVPDNLWVISFLYGGLPLVFSTYEDLLAKYSDLTTIASPIYYYQDPLDIWSVYPYAPVGDTTSVRVNYVPLPAQIALLSDTPISQTKYHEDLVIFCKMRAYERNQDRGSQEAAYNEFNARIGTRKDEEDVQENTYPVIRDDPWEF